MPRARSYDAWQAEMERRREEQFGQQYATDACAEGSDKRDDDKDEKDYG